MRYFGICLNRGEIRDFGAGTEPRSARDMSSIETDLVEFTLTGGRQTCR